MLKRLLLITATFLSANMAHAYEGIYTVPVSDDLRPFASNPLNNITWRSEEGPRINFSFTVPADLTGEDPVVIQLREVGHSVSGMTEMVSQDGPRAKASCLITRQNVVCMVKYERLVQNQAAISHYLNAKYSDESTRIGKNAVALFFSGEPAGIVEFSR